MNSTVSIKSCNDYEMSAVRSALAELLSQLGGMDSYVKKDDTVILKPNLVHGHPAHEAVNTHPAVVQAVAEQVLDCGGKPVIADSPPITTAQKAAHVCGIKAFADKLNIPIVELKQPTTTSRHSQIYTKGIATPKLDAFLLDANVIINLPKLKAHDQMLITAAVKNVFGCVPGRRKPVWHFKLQKSPDIFAEMLLAVMEKVSPELTIVDSIVAMERKGPRGGDPKQVGLMMAGVDCVAIDRVISELLSVPVQDHFVLRTAEKLNFETTNLNHIHLTGLPLDQCKVDQFVLPELMPVGFSVTHLARGFIKKLIKKNQKDDLAPAS